MFVPHLVAAHTRKRNPVGPGGRNRGPGAALAAVALSAGLVPVLGAMLNGVHGDAVAAGVIIVLLSAGLGFGVARVIGRQG